MDSALEILLTMFLVSKFACLFVMVVVIGVAVKHVGVYVLDSYVLKPVF